MRLLHNHFLSINDIISSEKVQEKFSAYRTTFVDLLACRMVKTDDVESVADRLRPPGCWGKRVQLPPSVTSMSVGGSGNKASYDHLAVSQSGKTTVMVTHSFYKDVFVKPALKRVVIVRSGMERLTLAGILGGSKARIEGAHDAALKELWE